MTTPQASRSPNTVVSNTLELTPDFDLPTAALEFKRFSFEAFEAYLLEKYHVSALNYSERFLYLGCEEDELPPQEERPQTIADLIAIWRLAERLPTTYQSGYRGQGPPVDTDPEVPALIKPLEELPNKVIEYLAGSVFPTC
ncbi:hypothetical protein ACHAPJ_011792 [Fusarium lateritium]